MNYKLIFNKSNIEIVCDCNDLTKTIDTIIMNHNKSIKNNHDLNYQMYGNGRGSNVEVYYNGTLVEIVEVSKA
jgi:hypothetical protein